MKKSRRRVRPILYSTAVKTSKHSIVHDSPGVDKVQQIINVKNRDRIKYKKKTDGNICDLGKVQ